MYGFYWLNDDIPEDLEKARKIYHMALENDVDDRDAVLERLRELEMI